MATFKERFNLIFEESTLNQKEFGAKFGASEDQVYNWRSRRGEPDSETMKKIAEANNVSVDWLIGKTDIRLQPKTVPPGSEPLYSLVARAKDLPEESKDEIARALDAMIQYHLDKRRKGPPK